MSDYLYAFASFGFLFWIARNAFFWGELLQNYNYSFRRTKKFLTESSEGRKILFSPLSLLKWIVIFSYPFIIFHENYELSYHFFVTIIYCVEVAVVVREMIQKKFFRRRVFTIKSFLIVFFTLTIGVFLFFFPPLDKFLWLVFIDRFIIFVIFFFLLTAALPEEFYWDYREAAAIEKLRGNTTLSSIIILGRKEAGVMKHILAHVLSKSADVLVVADDPNEKTVIETILKNLTPSHAYLLSDAQNALNETIKLLLALQTPDFFIIHSIPGTRQEVTTMYNKFLTPLLMKKRPNSRAVFINADNISSRKLPVGKKKNFQFYSGDPKKNTVFAVESITLEKSRTHFSIHYKETTVTGSISLISSHAVTILLPVIGVLLETGINPEVIVKRLKNDKMPDNFLHYHQRRGIVYIHHSLETDPTVLLDFFSYLTLFNKTRIIVLDTEIFSDRFFSEEYSRIGKELSRQFDYIFLISSPFSKYVKQGIQTGSKNCIVSISSPQEIIQYLPSLLQKDDIVLFYGPKTASIYHAITSVRNKSVRSRL